MDRYVIIVIKWCLFFGILFILKFFRIIELWGGGGINYYLCYRYVLRFLENFMKESFGNNSL